MVKRRDGLNELIDEMKRFPGKQLEHKNMHASCALRTSVLKHKTKQKRIPLNNVMLIIKTSNC